MPRRLGDLAATALIIAAAAAYVLRVFWQRAVQGSTLPNVDYYGYYYPNLLYAMQSVERGWGLLWNPFQNCGQPFFAIATTGLTYPLHAVFLLFGPELGQFVEVGLHLAIGGLGLYWLARELDVGRAGALTGGLAFAIGGVTILFASWVPNGIGPYAWMPAALAAGERLLRAPRLGRALLLAVILAVQLLPGYPQISLFTYLAIGVRAAVVLAAPGDVRRLPLLAALAVAFVLPIGLAALQYFPAIEFTRESLRAGQLSRAEIFPAKQTITWNGFLGALGNRTGFGAALMLVPFLLAGAAVAAPARRAVAWSYAALLALSLALAFDTPIFALFRLLPIGGSFRMPHRFLALTACILCVLAALGVDSVARAGAAAPRRRLAALLGAVAAAAGFAALSPVGLYAVEQALMVAALIGVAAALYAARLRRAALLALPVLVAVNCVALAALPVYGPLRDANLLRGRSAAFDWLRQRMTLQDRAYPLAQPGDFSLSDKTAALFGVRSISDYEAQSSRRFANAHVFLFRNRPMRTINDYYFKLERRPQNRPLFDLLATRYLIADDGAAQIIGPRSGPPLQPIATIGETIVYENAAALPRAFFAPQAAVMPETDAALQWLASGNNDPRRVVLLEREPADGFLGTSAAQPGMVTITEDRGETLRLDVRAPADGFLVVTDQFYPGWQATVNGTPAPILRANAAFRALRVPAGESTVEFIYRPLSLRLGAAVSALSWALVLAYVAWRVRWGRKAPSV